MYPGEYTSGFPRPVASHLAASPISRRHPAHEVYPYLLHDPNIIHSNHGWAADMTYIPIRRGLSACLLCSTGPTAKYCLAHIEQAGSHNVT